jgi:membrane protease YdiL (CAAX protease family)
MLFCVSLPPTKRNNRMANTAFRDMKPFSQLMFAIFIMMASVILLMVAGMLLALPFANPSELMNSLSPEADSASSIAYLKYIQIIQSVGLFVIPPFILAYLYHGNITGYLSLNQSAPRKTYLVAALILVAAIPSINFIGDLNKQMSLPAALSDLESWMRSMEDAAELMVEKFMKIDRIAGLLFNIFMIAIIPALGEELMFRGIIQRIFTSWTKNPHWGIWITAFLFSAMHMQFYGFLPRLMLGALFGYMLVWTGSMWVPILAHFVNNALGVLGYYLINKGVITNDIEEIGVGSEQLIWTLLSMIAAIFLLTLLYRSSQAKKCP